MFSSRNQAGSLLASKIFSEIKTGILVAIPRGGIVVADSIRKSLNWPLFLIIAQKLSAPGNEELAIGAVGERGSSVFLDQKLISQLVIDDNYLDQEITAKIVQNKERQKEFAFCSRPSLTGKKVVLVDDGVATGATIIAAARQAREENPDEVIVAVPVISRPALERIKKEADRVIYLESPELFFSVSQFYRNFDQVSDEEVKRILRKQE